MELDFETLIEEEVGEDVMWQIAGIVREAYDITADMLDRYPTLGHCNGVYAWGWNRYLHVNNALLMAAEAGELGCLKPFKQNVSSTMQRVYLKTKRVSIQTAFVVEMRDPESGLHNFPKIGNTRVPEIIHNHNQMVMIEIDDGVGKSGYFEFFLLHGGNHRAFESCHLAMVDSIDQKSYRWTSKNYALHAALPEFERPIEVDEFKPQIIEEEDENNETEGLVIK